MSTAVTLEVRHELVTGAGQDVGNHRELGCPYLVCGKPRSTTLDAGSGHRVVTTF